MLNGKFWFLMTAFKSFLPTVLFKCLMVIAYKPHIFVDRCLQENPNLPSAYDPYTILSLCHLRHKENSLTKQETGRTKPLPRFSHHSFIIKFENILTVEEALIFQTLYEQLFISQAQRNLFQFIGSAYREFWQYSPSEVNKELLRTRWNLDEFILLNSPGARDLLIYSEYQLPTFLQRQEKLYKTNNISDIKLLSYYITSGYGQKCVHNSWETKLLSLTYDFTAYDRIFCDALEYHGLQNSIGPYWNLGDMYYWRGRLIRDGLVSSFPPDSSNAVYYACPQLTFVVLQQKPKTWMFVIRPFEIPLWIFLAVAFTALEFIRHLKQFIDYYHEIKLKRQMIQRKLFAVIVGEDEIGLDEIGNRYLNVLAIFNGILRIMLTSAYSGMILVGILHPLYPWTPDTFVDLNHTENYFIGTAEFSPYFIASHLAERLILNGIKPNMIRDRKKLTPAEFLEYSVSKDFTSRKENDNKFYAAIMYDDKMNLWLKGRSFIWRTASFLDQIKPSKDKVLPEIRYVSVAPGATRLHFLIVTLKRVFTSGTWMRWYYLEQNYYKNVAPIVAVRKLKDMGKEQPRDKKKHRPLSLYDLFSIFLIKDFALGLSFFLCMFEMYTKCSYSLQI